MLYSVRTFAFLAASVSAVEITVSTYALNCDCSSTPIDVKYEVGCTAVGTIYTKVTCDAGTVTTAQYTTTDCSGTVVAGSELTYTNDECKAVCVFGVGVSSKVTGCEGAPPCFARESEATLSNGQTLPMSELKAGDYVLPGPTRVIVNQHASAPQLKASLLDIEHTNGELSLTADHVISVDGAFVAAREAVVGSKLGESEVSRVSGSVGGIINPLTVSGKILADGVLASTYPEWIASYMLSSSVLPTYTLSNLVSFLFPATTQAYYDAHLERFFQSTSPNLVSLKAILPAPLVAAIFVVADLSAVTGFVVYSLASAQALLAVIAVAAVLKASRK